jgi:hypothetical protein
MISRRSFETYENNLFDPVKNVGNDLDINENCFDWKAI